MAFVLCGNFCQGGWESEGGLKRYTSQLCPLLRECKLISADGFNALTDLLVSLPLLHSSHFVFVPGPLDPWSSTTLPRPALPSIFSGRMTQRIPKVRFVSNPCRLRYFGQEITICREDLMGKMVRGLVGVKKEEGVDMKRYVSLFISEQANHNPARSDRVRSSTSFSSAHIDKTNVMGV
jgi:DNA polymerase epsilon subunit 2